MTASPVNVLWSDVLSVLRSFLLPGVGMIPLQFSVVTVTNCAVDGASGTKSGFGMPLEPLSTVVVVDPPGAVVDVVVVVSWGLFPLLLLLLLLADALKSSSADPRPLGAVEAVEPPDVPPLDVTPLDVTPLDVTPPLEVPPLDVAPLEVAPEPELSPLEVTNLLPVALPCGDGSALATSATPPTMRSRPLSAVTTPATRKVLAYPARCRCMSDLHPPLVGPGSLWLASGDT
jgi:hypothetical protein